MSINNEWAEVQLGDVVDDVTVGHVGPMASEYVQTGIPFLRSQNVVPLRIVTNDIKFITPEFHNRLKKSSLSPGDVVIVRTGKPGAAAVIPNSIPVANCSDLVIVRPGSRVDARYIVYYINTVAYHHVSAHLVGAVQQHFNVGSARTMRLRLPPLPLQKRIADILGSLDDKIELNQRTNETLKAMSRTLFQSWFVDFDPVRAKADGQKPQGMDAATAKLFPDSFVTSRIGRVPSGWRMVPIGDHIEAVKGLSYKGDGLAESGKPLHNLNSVYEGGGYKYEGIKFYTGEYKDRHLVRPGDVIVANTEQGHDLLLIGYPAIVPKFYGDSGLFSHHLYRVRPRESSSLTNHFIYFQLMERRFRDEVTGHTNGTTVNMLAADGLQRPQFAVPPRELVLAFDRVVAPLFEKSEQLHRESLELGRLRDVLLPKLLSGEVPVSQTDAPASPGGPHG